MGTGDATGADDQLPDPLSGWVDTDLASQLAGQERHDVDLAAADLAVAEWAGLSLADRWLAWVGSSVTFGLRDGTVSAGLVQAVLSDAFVVVGTGGEVLIPGSAIVWCRGDPSRARGRPANLPRSAAGVLRSWSSRRRELLVVADGLTLRGFVTRVGADHLDVSGAVQGEPAPGEVTTFAWAAVVRVQATG